MRWRSRRRSDRTSAGHTAAANGHYKPERFEEMLKATKVTEFLGLDDFRGHYVTLFNRFGVSNEHLQPKVLGELFLFRCWGVQFGFGLFSSYDDLSEEIRREVAQFVNAMGVSLFNLCVDIYLPDLFDEDFDDVYADRVNRYNEVLASSDSPLPTTALVATFLEIAEVFDIALILALSDDFATNLAAIKARAIEIGLLVP